MRNLFCFFGFHDWVIKQHGFMIETGNCEVVIAWKQCRDCGASRLIHILK